MALNLQLSGYFDQAKSIVDWARSLTDDYWDDSRTLYHIYTFSAWIENYRRNWKSSSDLLAEYMPKAEEFGDPYFIGVGKTKQFIARGGLEKDVHMEKMEEIIEDFVSEGATIEFMVDVPFLVEILYEKKRFEPSLMWIEKYLAHAQKVETCFGDAEIHRVKGLILQAKESPDLDIEHCFQTAIDISQKQSAKLFELRASRDLARFWKEQKKYQEAYQLLNGIYNWFTEGFDTSDMQEAHSLLVELENLVE